MDEISEVARKRTKCRKRIAGVLKKDEFTMEQSPQRAYDLSVNDAVQTRDTVAFSKRCLNSYMINVFAKQLCLLQAKLRDLHAIRFPIMHEAKYTSPAFQVLPGIEYDSL